MNLLRTSRPGRVALIALGVAALTVSSVGPAQAAGPKVVCGATLTANAKLTKNLTCAGNGVTLTSGVTLDLGGHRFSGGGGNGTAVLAAGSDGNRVVNGTIADWGLAVDFTGTDYTAPLTLKKLRIARAPLSTSVATVLIDHSRLNLSPVSSGGTRLTVRYSRLKASNTGGEGASTLIDHSSVIGGGVGLEESNSVRIVDSTMDGAGYDGQMDLCDISRSIINSTVTHYSQALWTHSCPTYITNSTFADNPNGALTVETPDGVVITDSIFRNDGAVAVDADNDLLVDHSTFTQNGIGIDVRDGSKVDILSSTFSQNTGDGIHAANSNIYLHLGNNLATDNGGYGINVSVARDLGGNRAHGNALGQCVGVVCTP